MSWRGRRGITRLTVGVVLAAALLVPQGVGVPEAQAQTPPGPCEAGWVAPTPTTVAVASVPITVSSTTDDYFVLYRKFEHSAGVFIDLPVSVTLGESGSITLAENLAPLAADQYRLDKYQVANPADIDGDCFDDISELNDFGKYNPVQRTLPIGAWAGGVAIEDRARFEKLSFKGDKGDWTDKHLNDLEFVKFWVFDIDSEWPRLYFQNTQSTQVHNILDKKMFKLKDCCWGSTVRGVLVFHPNVVAPDGSLGVYRIEYQPWDAFGFRRIELTYELIASAMPFLADNLAYYPGVGSSPLKKYNAQKALYDASRVRILHTKDIMPDVAYTMYNPAEGYGLLRELAPDEAAGPRDVVILEVLPNDLPRAAGVISTVPQTPLAHVNLRAIQNGVPNAFIRDALDEDYVTDLIGKHVRYQTTSSGFTLQAATKAEVDAHHAASRPAATQTPQRDLSVKKIASLDNIAFGDWTAFGVKAANVAELSNLSALAAGVAPDGFAVPFYFYDEFMKQATLGEETILGKKKAPDAEKITLAAGTTLAEAVTAMLAHSHFQADYDTQEEMLDDLRKAIKKATTPAWIITELEQWHAKYPGQSLRYRSSTNNEDLPDFNGAGLYDSKTQDPDETADEGIDKSIKAVWASLWNYRAFLERDWHRVDHTATAMGVLVHPNYTDERANGVAVSVDPVTGLDNMHYVNTQLGEDLVTNPEANSLPEQLLLDSAGTPTVLARSNLAQPGQLLMSDAQMVQLRNSLDAIHSHFAALYNVQAGDDFAMEIEFKITSADQLAIKQARPWVFPVTPLTAIWIPNPAIVAQVQAAIDNHVDNTGNKGAAGRLRKVLAGINGETGGYTTSECRDEARKWGVSAAWKPWCDEIERRENAANKPPPPKPEVSITAGAAVTEGAGAVFTVTASPVPASELTVSVDVSQSGDFTAATGTQTVTIPANTASATLTVATVDDSTDEADGSVTATLTGGGSTYTVAAAPNNTASVTVADDDDPAPVVDTSALEGLIQERIDKTAASGAVHSNRIWRGALAAVRGVDPPSDAREVDAADAQRLADNHRSGGRTVLADLWQDIADTINGNPPPPPSTKPKVTITANAAGVVEGQTAVFTVSVNPVSSQELYVSVDVTQSGNWTTSTGGYSMQILANTASVLLPVRTVDDSADEPDGSVTATLAAGQGYAVGTAATASVAVSDDDDPPLTPEIAITAGADVTEGGNATFTVVATPAPQSPLNVTVNVTQSGDYTSGAGTRTVVVGSGGTTTLIVATVDDSTDEADGSVTATVQAGSGYTVGTAATASVAVSDDDDPPPIPEISITADGDVTEGGDATFTVTASPVPQSPLNVTVDVSAAGDFGAGTGTRTVTIGTGGTATLAVATVNDSTDEADGTVTATVQGGSGYAVGSQSSATVGVSDDDDAVPPEVGISAAGDVTEGSAAVFTVSVSPVQTQPLTVALAVTQSGDWISGTPPTGVTIPAGTASATLTVTTVDDSTDEPDGAVTAVLVADSAYTIGTAISAAVAVADDDLPEAGSLDCSNSGVQVSEITVAEREWGFAFAFFEVTLCGDNWGRTYIEYHVEHIDTDDADFGYMARGMLVFNPFETAKRVHVQVNADRVAEGDETFALVLHDVDSYRHIDLGTGKVLGTITDNN